MFSQIKSDFLTLIDLFLKPYRTAEMLNVQLQQNQTAKYAVTEREPNPFKAGCRQL